MAKQPNRRKQLIVDEKAQARLIVAMAWPVSCIVAVIGLLLGGLLGRMADEAAKLGVEIPVTPTLATIGCFMFISLCVVLFLALRMSHRIAGPSYRLKKTLEAFRDGDRACRANLRDRDYLMDVAADLNVFLDWVQEQVGEPERAEDAVGETEDAASDQPEPAARS